MLLCYGCFSYCDSLSGMVLDSCAIALLCLLVLFLVLVLSLLVQFGCCAIVVIASLVFGYGSF